MIKNFFENDLEILITCSFGLEAVLKRELLELGYDDIIVENGRISFVGNINDVFITNLYIRTGDRVYLRLKQFKLGDGNNLFDEFFDNINTIDFQNILPQDANFIVNAKSISSKLHSVRSIQSVAEKAIIKKLNRYYDIRIFPKSGARYEFEVNLIKDVVEILLDTSGVGLHKRGYRKAQGEAPIKETLAAAMVLLSRWDMENTLIDPFCGSGTIAIEAAMIAKNIAPGLNRDFAFLHWKGIELADFERFKLQAQNSINPSNITIVASDIDDRVLRIARQNAKNAKVSEIVKFVKKDFADFDFGGNKKLIITNPPYGKRLNEVKEVEKLYKFMGQKLRSHKNVSLYLITLHEQFETLYGTRSTKKRKLYNGRIKVYYYQFY